MAHFDRYDICSAYWLFGAEHHGGMGTPEYAYMSRAEKCGFRPGLNFSYHSLSDNGIEIYWSLGKIKPLSSPSGLEAVRAVFAKCR